MTSSDKAGVVAVSLTVALAIAVTANAVLASASWQSHAPTHAPARTPAPAPTHALIPSSPVAPSVLHVRLGELETHAIAREAVRRVFHQTVPELERCRTTATRRDLEGRIVVHVQIERHHVETLVMTTTMGQERAFEQCLVDALSWAPWPRLRRAAEVVIPLVLDTTEE